MFQTSREQRYADDFSDLRAGGDEDDASYFAGLRAQADESGDWGADDDPDAPYSTDSSEYSASYSSGYSAGTRLSDRPAIDREMAVDPRMPSPRTPAEDPWADADADDRASDAWDVPEIDDRAGFRPAPQSWDTYIEQDDYAFSPSPSPSPEDPYRRSDIVSESHTDPTGWKATGPARPPIPDDRPPAESLSGNRLLTVLLFFSGLATSISLWLFDTQAGAVNDTATLMLAAGRVMGLTAGYVLFIQLLMMSRVAWLEEWVGARDLLRWHRWLGTTLVVTVLAHIVFITYGYALTAKSGVVDQAMTIITTFPDMFKALAATTILVVISLISIRALRNTLPYELWHLLHLTSYLVLLLGYGHQVATGADLSGRFASVWWPALTALVISALVWGRLIEPLWLNMRHKFEVAEVVAEGATATFSIYIDGKNLEKLPAKAGQFMRWRFLTRNGWWQSHPFSLSAAPNSEWLRLTVTAVGGHTERLATMKPGTPVWAEGPFGVFTAQRRTRRRALLIAGGSGIAPIRALLEDMPPDTIVIYRAGRPDELVFRGELEELAERRDAWVRYIVGARTDPGPRRLFTPSGLLGLVPDVSRRDVYLCGPPGLVEVAVSTLRELDVPDSQLHLDPFEF